MHAHDQRHRQPGEHGHPDHGHEHGSAAGAPFGRPRRYDLVTAVAFAGRGRRFRAHLARRLDAQPGRRVLDVGCGAGTLTLALARAVFPAGTADGVDAAPEMIAAATRKAGKARRGRAPARFQVATAQHLPFPDGSVDAVVTSLMVHHLPAGDRATAVAELLRVLRPGGRLVIADAQTPARGGRLARRFFGHAIEHSDLDAVAELATASGAVDVHRDASPVSWIGLVVARAPVADGEVPTAARAGRGDSGAPG